MRAIISRNPVLTVMCFSLAAASAGCATAPDIGGPINDAPANLVVEKALCELGQAIKVPMSPAAPSTQDRYAWFKTWAAKVELVLATGDTLQINPTGTLTSPLHDAYPAVGTSTLGGAAISAVLQKFTFGVGGGASEQRSRTESISFTVKLADLYDYYKSSEQSHCQDPGFTESSALGFKEWINNRIIVLVEDGKEGRPAILRPGYHQAAAIPAAPNVNAPPIRNLMTAYEPKPPTTSAKKSLLDRWQNYFDARKQYVEDLVNAVHASNVEDCKKAEAVLKKRQADLIELSKTFSASREKFLADIALPGTPNLDADYKSALAASSKVQDIVSAVDVAIKKCPKPKPDPPIDSASFVANFVISGNLGVAPNWGLLRVGGPSPASGSLLSYARANTHMIQVILVPLGGDPSTQLFVNALRNLSIAPPGQGIAGSF